MRRTPFINYRVIISNRTCISLWMVLNIIRSQSVHSTMVFYVEWKRLREKKREWDEKSDRETEWTSECRELGQIDWRVYGRFGARSMLPAARFTIISLNILDFFLGIALVLFHSLSLPLFSHLSVCRFACSDIYANVASFIELSSSTNKKAIPSKIGFRYCIPKDLFVYPMSSLIFASFFFYMDIKLKRYR